jgi:hypothetical protein
MGWAGKENGELLALAESSFEVFVTTDQKIKNQQSIAGRNIAVVVFVVHRNNIESLRPLVPELERALTDIKPGDLREVRGPELRRGSSSPHD